MIEDMSDEYRDDLRNQINSRRAERDLLEKLYGKVWDTSQFIADFQLINFLAPMVMVKRRSDGVIGSLFFQHYPRYYFLFVENSVTEEFAKQALMAIVIEPDKKETR